MSVLPVAAPAKPNPRRGLPRSEFKGHYTFDPEKVKDLRQRGLTCAEIGAVVGVHESSIYRFLERAKAEAGHVKTYRENRADILSRMGARMSGLIEGVSDSLVRDLENGVLDSRKPEVKAGIIRDLAVVKGVVFDKERLERGQSTSNTRLIASIMGSALDSAYDPVQNPQKALEISDQSQTPHQGVRLESGKTRRTRR